MKHLVKCLSERKRRTFLRFMNGKKKNKKETEDGEVDQEEKHTRTCTRTREELLQKIDELKLEGEDFNGVLDSDEDDEFDYDSDQSEEA